MNPINNNKESCSPVSSNCVIWQGDDIECISLCKGATVTDVVAALATELCEILEYTKISNYDLKCLTLNNCPPKDFEVLIQLIIDKLCELEGEIVPTPSTTREGCPICEVVIASCFRFTNEFGDLVISMNFTDYVTAIGNKVCYLVTQINTINLTLEDHEIRIEALENAPAPTFNLPLVTPVCVLPSVPTDMNIVLTALESSFCTLIGATGQGADIYNALTQQCAGLNNGPQLGGVGTMGTLPNWASNVQNLAQSLNNLWLTICDLRSAVQIIQNTCCSSGCDGVELAMTASINGTNIIVFLTGTIPPGFVQCAPGTTEFTVSDGISSISVQLNILTMINLPGGYPISLNATPLNLASNLTVSTTICLEEALTGTTCQSMFSYTAPYPGNCPAMNYVQGDTYIQFAGIAGNTGIFIVELWNNAGTILISTQNFNLSIGGNIVGSFTSLTSSTAYKLRVQVIPGGNGIPLYCPFTSIQTQVGLCPDVTNLVVTITP